MMGTTTEVTNLCQCGRLKEKVHCPECGSYVVAGLVRGSFVTKLDSGELVPVRVYRCRRCTCKFSDIDRASCKASPPTGGALAPQRAAEIREFVKIPEQNVLPEYQGLTWDERLAKAKEKLNNGK